MATKYSAPKYDFQKTLQWINGDKYYLQVSTEAFYNMFDENDEQRERSKSEQLNSKQLLRISKRAFEKGELDVAEKFVGKAIQRQKIEDASSERNPELYCHLAEVLQQRATKDTLQKLERQKLLLQATALYMFVRNCLNKSNEKSELVVNISKSLPQKILDVQHYIIETASGNTSTCKFNCEIKKKALKELRKEANASLEDINNKYDAETGSDDDLREKFIKQTSEVKILFKRIATRVKQLFVEIIEECLDVLGNPPCDYEVMILGSLAREEMTPYSDIEWAILTNSEDDECKTFFRNLTNLVHFQIINFGETILPCLDIEVLRGDWFYDDVTPRGLSFDALLPQACKTPLGNTVDFELIHTPQTMANFQSEYWHKKKPDLGDILLTVAPLKDDQQTLLSQYKEIVKKILLEPCDKDNCSSNNTLLTKGASRGHQILSKDADRYGKTMLDSHQAFDGKVYDVKKEVYRLTDRVVAGLSKVFGIATTGSFEILDGLCKSNVICSSAKENITSAVAIALKFRLSTYLLAEKQDEAIKTRSKDSSNETWLENSGLTTYDVARKKELFHFFYVSTPLYELLRTFSADDRMNSEDFMGNLFFDCSDKVKGHIHCRLLNYVAALDCYKRAQCNVKSDYENIDLRIRRLRLEFMLSMSSDVLFIKEELKIILEEIDKKATDSIASKHERKFLDQFVDVHLFHASFCLSQGDVEIARESLEQCKNIESYVSDFQKLTVRLNIIHVSQIQIPQKEFDDIISQLNALVKDEGNSVMGLIWLNELGKFLMHQKKNAEAYQCLQRALLMGRILFSNNVNFHVLWTLFMLGTVCFRSLMYEEAKFYFSKILEPLLSFDEQMSVIIKREVYRQLATLSTFTDNQEDAITFFENSLECSNISGGRANADLMVNGLTHCGIATTWFKLGENEKAWISALNAKDCLEKIPYNQNKVSLECFVSKTFMDIGKTDEAMLLLKQGLAKQHDAVLKENYLDSLGQLCFKKGLKEDAEYYYKKSLEILKSVNSDTPKIIERLLNIADLLINNKKSSEAFIYLSDTSKYVLALVDSNEKCNYLKKMAYNWEEMGDYYEARNCLEQAVKVCESSQKNAKVLPIDEFDLHIKLSDVVAKTLASLSSNDEESTNEQIKNAQWLHYDRAGNALRQQLATGQFNSQTVSLFLLLASKYHSIDLMEKEKLLLEALEMSKMIYGPEEKNKQVASILIELANLYLSKKEYESAASFFERSLQMDMEIHRLDPYHINISHEISVLTGLFMEYPQWPHISTTIQQVLIFLEKHSKEEAFMNSVVKANCFTEMALLCCFLGDFKKAETLNKIARDIFATVKENELPSNIIPNEKCCSLIDLMVNRVANASDEVLIKLRKSLPLLREMLSSLPDDGKVCKSVGSSSIFSNEGKTEKSAVTSSPNKPLIENKASENSFTTGTTMEMSRISKMNSNLKNVSVSTNVLNRKEDLTLLHIASREKLDVPSDVPELMQSKDSNEQKVSIKLRANQSNITDKNDMVYTVDKNEEKNPNVNQSIHQKEMSDLNVKLEELKTDVQNISSLADSIMHSNKTGDLETGLQTTKDSLDPLLASFYGKLSGDPIQFVLNEAENARKKKDINALMGSIELASKFLKFSNIEDSKLKAKISKLNGECQLLMKNYRTAAISFEKAVSFHRSATTELDLDHYIEYAESLIGLVKSHLLCNKVQEAQGICEEGLAIGYSIQPQWITSRLLVQLFYLAAKCKIQKVAYSNDEEDLKQVMLFCQQALETSEFVDHSCGTNDITEELGLENGEFFALKYDIRLLMASTFLRQKNLEQAQKVAKELKEFLQNIVVVLEMFSKDTWSAGKDDFLRIQLRLFSLIGRASVITNETGDALINFKKSLAILLHPDCPEAVGTSEEIIALLDGLSETISKTSVEKSYCPIQGALEVCKHHFLEVNDKLNKLWVFFSSLGTLYINENRIKDSIIVFKKGLEIAECLDDQSDSRGQALVQLANAYRLQAIANKKLGSNVFEEHHLAEKYFQTKNGNGTENSSAMKNIMYAYFLCEVNRFKEATVILMQTVEDDTLWSRNVFCEFSKGVLYGPDIQSFIESYGELFTNMGNLAYSLLVRANVEIRNKREAVKSHNKLSTDGRDLPKILGVTTSCLSYLLVKSEKYLLSLIEEPDKLLFDESDFPLSLENLAKVYYELEEYELTVKLCDRARKSDEFSSTSCKLSISHLEANAMVMTTGNYAHYHYKMFLDLLQQEENILDRSFNDQQAILSQYSYPGPYYVYYLLASMLDEKKVDRKIALCEHCLLLDLDYDIDQNVVGTLTDLYQTKALIEGKDDEIVYHSWLDKAQSCFEELINRKIKMAPFVEISYASFLKRAKRFDEAISHFEQVLSNETLNFKILYSEVDLPLSDVCRAREIQARGKLILHAKMSVYYQLIQVYLESGKSEKAEECALRMEEYVNSLTYDPIVHSFLAYTLKETGQERKARDILQQVLYREPDNEPVKLALEEIQTLE